ncbi:MAG: hypothetical protein L3J74_17035, partial [Bacteroidales bacterium]|nr:hypothetical protein [Bacteroidales bacterium]
NVNVKASKQIQAIVIPAAAIIRTGVQEQVFVQREAGKFEPRKVTLGVETDGFVQIKEGIKVGEAVVTSGQFLIDSESKLKEATAKMMEVLNQSNTPAPDMQGMTMDEMDMDGMGMDGAMQMDDMDIQHQHGAHP